MSSDRIVPREPAAPGTPGADPTVEQPTVHQPGAETPPEREAAPAEGTDEILGSKSDYVIVGGEPP